MDKKLTGIYAALLTPFDTQGNINYQALEKNVDYQISKGMAGFYVCGSTGEAFLLTTEEKKTIISTVCQVAEKRATVIAHCGDIGTDKTIDLALSAKNAGVDAISAVTPFYYGFSPDEIISFYTDLANAAQMPTIVYNIPKLSGVSVNPSMMGRMRENTNIVGLKFTSSDFFSMEQIKTANPDLIVYNGYDEMYLAGLSFGADGAIGSTYNIMGKLFIQIQKQFLLGKMQEALQLQKTANYVISQLVSTGKLLAVLKYILTLRGFGYGASRRPFALLSEVDKQKAKEINEYLIQHEIDF
jgi:N-acetylneuraminate lyase